MIREVVDRWQQEAVRENRWYAVRNRESVMKRMETRELEREREREKRKNNK
jgi:hypothetical protein